MDLMVSLSETSYDSAIPGLGKERKVHFQDFSNTLVTVFFFFFNNTKYIKYNIVYTESQRSQTFKLMDSEKRAKVLLPHWLCHYLICEMNCVLHSNCSYTHFSTLNHSQQVRTNGNLGKVCLEQSYGSYANNVVSSKQHNVAWGKGNSALVHSKE